ncbi:MAG TPA: DUF4064 domain-containing protein [Chloroflexia bacterium]|nr:DUF4064 domain-containing protein [Chloroflexia bacterium]
MRVAAMVLGIIGGVLGFLLAGFLFVVGGIGKAAATAAADPTVTSNLTASEQADLQKDIKAVSDAGTLLGGLGLVLIVLCVVAIAGGIITAWKPPIGAIMLAVSGIGGFFCASIFWGFSGLLLIIGAVLALLASFKKATPQAQPVPAVSGGYYPGPQPGYPQGGYYPQQPGYPQQAQGYNQYQQPGYPQQNYYPAQSSQQYPPRDQQAGNR